MDNERVQKVHVHHLGLKVRLDAVGIVRWQRPGTKMARDMRGAPVHCP